MDPHDGIKAPRRGRGPVQNKNLPLSQEARERLCLYALRCGKSESVVADWVISSHEELRRYVLSDRGKGADAPADDPDGNVDPASATLPLIGPVTSAEAQAGPDPPGEGRGGARRGKRAG